MPTWFIQVRRTRKRKDQRVFPVMETTLVKEREERETDLCFCLTQIVDNCHVFCGGHAWVKVLYVPKPGYWNFGNYVDHG